MVAVRLGDLEGESARDLELGSAKSVSWGICQNAGWVTALFEMENRLRALLSAINQIDAAWVKWVLDLTLLETGIAIVSHRLVNKQISARAGTIDRINGHDVTAGGFATDPSILQSQRITGERVPLSDR